jgi:uncharacterized protein YjdB
MGVATIDGNTGVVTGVSAGTSVISYTVTNGAGCSTTVNHVVTVYANPVVSPITGIFNVCVNCVRNLNNSTSGGVWSSSDTAIAKVNINGQVLGVSPGTSNINYTVTSSNGCSTTVSQLFTVNANPVVNPITGNPTVCVGGTTQLTSSPSGGVWGSNDSSVAKVNSSTGLVTGIAGGTALISYTVTDNNGCSTTVTKLITVNIGPLVNAVTGNGNICVSQTTVLSNTTSGGIWTSSNTSVAMVNSSGVVTGLSAGSATISYTVTGSNGCSTSSTKVVNVYAYPMVDPITGYSSVCAGSSIALSSSPSGGVWSSNNPGIATVNSATGVVTGVSAGSAIISYTVTNANGCSTIVSRTVTVNGKPVVDPITGNNNLCVGNTATLSSTTPSGTWSSSNTGVATINSSGVVTAIAAGTTTITYTVVDGNGCVGTAMQTITVNANPVLGPISGSSSVCVGKTITLSNSSSGGVWSSSNTAVATINATTGVVTGVAAGTSTMSYTVTSSSGCSATVYNTVTVYNNPTVDPISGKTNTCVGGSVTFSSNTVGGVWSVSDTSVAIINSNTGVLTGISAGTVVVSYTVTNGNGCSTTVTYNFTVKANPVVSPIMGQFNVCIGSISTLTNTTSGGVWNSSNTGVATITSNGIVTAVSVGSTTMSYTVTGSNGCSTTVTQVLTVYAYPVVSPITGTTSVCVGGATTLSSATVGGVWSSSNTAVATINATTGVVTGLSAGIATMSYTVSNAAGCSTVVTKDITVNANPVVNPIMGSGTVCVGSSITLNNSTIGGAWSSSNTAVATINSAGMVTGVSAGTATMSYTVTNGSGCSTTVSKDIIVNANPVVNPITGSSNVCVGSTITLNNSTSAGVWSSSNTAVATISSTGVVTGIAPGTAIMSYMVTNASGCTTTVSKDVTVNANPVVNPITGSSNVCVGSTITLSSVTAGGVWSSSNTAIATINSNTGIVTGIAPGTVTISYTLSNANNCSTTVTKDVTVNANPVVAAITGGSAVCVGNNLSVSNATIGGVWSSSNTAVATVNNSGLVTAVSAGTTTISYMVTNASGCTTTVTKDITVNANPVVAAIAGNSAVCVGSTISLSNATSGGTWSSSNTAIATVNSNTGLVTGVSPGVATMSYTVTNSTTGCSTTVTKDVTVNANPTINPITGNAGVCVGSTITLSNTTSGGTWSSSNTAVATINASTGEITAIAAGTATISYAVTNSNGCTTTVTKNITVYANPVLSPIAGGSVACVGSNIALSNPTIGGVWSSSNTAVATISSTGQVTGVSSGTATITYTYTNANGCTSSVSKDISVYDSPTVSPITMNCSCSGNLCVGQSITLSSATVGGVWGCGNINVATISSTGVVTAVAPGTAIVSYTVTNANGCSTTVTQTITVHAYPPVPTITASGPTDICVGSSVTLSSSSATGNQWYKDGVAISGATNQTYTINSSGSYSVTVTNVNNCSSTAASATVVTVSAYPVVSPITGSSSLCAGQQTTLANATAGGTWSSSNAAVATIHATTGQLTAIAAGSTTISYMVTNAAGCSKTVTYTVTVNALPVLSAIAGNPILCVGATATFSNATVGGVWSSSNTAVATVNNTTGTVTAIASGSTTISYTLTNTNNCSATVTQVVSVEAKPTVAAIACVTSICTGTTTTATNSTAGGVWSSSNTAVATINSATGQITAISAGSTMISYTVTNASGCSTTVTQVVSIINTPAVPTIAVSGPTYMCAGSSITLYSSSASGNQWYRDGVMISGATAQQYTTGNAGSYTVVVNNGSCGSSSSAATVVSLKPTSSSTVYANFCRTCNYLFNGQVYTTAGTYTKKLTNVYGCDSTITLILIDTCGNVSGGGGGGVESKTLGDVISKRLYGNAVNSVAEVNGYNNSTKFTQSGAIVNGPNDLTLSNLVPATVNNTNAAYISTPVDLVNFTNAVEVLAVDYTQGGITKAVAFGTKTLGDVYNHTKPICDRLKGAELLEVRNITVNGYSLMAYKIKQRTGEIEFAVNLSAGTAANRSTISLQSNWFTDNYQPDEKLYNFQLWAISYDMVQSMAQDIITKLQNNGGVNSVTSADLPKAYISKGNRKATDLTLTIQNNTTNTAGYFQIEEKANENASTTTRKIPFTVAANGTTTLTVPVKDYYEGSMYVYLNNNLTDLVYLADGTWSLDYDKTKTTINKFNVVNEGNYTSKASEYRLMRNVEMVGTTKNYISIYKTMMGGGLEQDVTAYQDLKFNVNAVGTTNLRVTLVKKGITNWDDQYSYTMSVDGLDKEYKISLSQFKSSKYNTSIKADDIVAVNFSYINPTGTATVMSVNMSKVRFVNNTIPTEVVTEQINLYPNPSSGRFVTKFKSNSSQALVLKVYEASTGKLIKQQIVVAYTGDNQVNINLTESQTTITDGIYIVTLEGDEQRYQPAKLIITKNK